MCHCMCLCGFAVLSIQGIFMKLAFFRLPPFLLFSIVFTLCAQFLQLSVMIAGAWAGFFWWAGLVPGLQVRQALRCSSFLGVGSAVPGPVFLSIQPPYGAKVLFKEMYKYGYWPYPELSIVALFQVGALSIANQTCMFETPTPPPPKVKIC